MLVLSYPLVPYSPPLSALVHSSSDVPVLTTEDLLAITEPISTPKRLKRPFELSKLRIKVVESSSYALVPYVPAPLPYFIDQLDVDVCRNDSPSRHALVRFSSYKDERFFMSRSTMHHNFSNPNAIDPMASQFLSHPIFALQHIGS